MNITLVISSLGSGGAERVLTRLANAWAAEGRSVVLMTLESPEATPFYPLDSRVQLRPLGVSAASRRPFEAIARNLRRLLVLRRAVRESAPDVVIAFTDLTNIRVLMALVGVRIPVIVSERVDPSQYSIGRTWSLLRKVVYPCADVLVVQSARAARFFPRHGRIRIIPNPVVVPPPAVRPHRAEARKSLVALGRLHEQKGYDMLFAAFHQVAARHPDWTLTIWGEGPERHALERLRDELGLADRVLMPGNTTHSFEKLAEADLFVLSSRFEGFPNALCEAMACGLPVISFDCPSGPAEIITHGEDGLLVPPNDTEQLAAALDRLMDDTAMRVRLGGNARSISQRFSLESVLAMWENAVREARRRGN